MPIKNLSERTRLPRLGKVRLGVKVEGQRSSYPKPVDYFVVNPDQSTPESMAKAFHDVYGEKPKVLDIMFPVHNIETFFPQWYRRYGKGTGLICKGDGVKAVEADRETGELREIDCNPDTCEWYQNKQCLAVGTLMFLLPKVPGIGCWQLDSRSINTILNLNSAIRFLMSLTGGRIAMIPLKLMVKPHEATVEGKKKTVYVLDLHYQHLTLEQMLKSIPQENALPQGIDLDMNEAPDDLFPPDVLADGKVIDGEVVNGSEGGPAETKEPPPKPGPQPAPEAQAGPARQNGNSGNGKIKWNEFWQAVYAMGITREKVLELAGVFFSPDINNPLEIKDLSKVCKDQGLLDQFVDWLPGALLR
ncbi:MAG: hypothetical protein C4570_06590 [Ammonifex sp.]|jgi:hypothetical protein|nr:MAG: hypothetical protein C4570_06590 [Ammonifex sp.]